MMSRYLLGLAFVVIAAGFDARGAEDKEDKGKLEGTWTATSYERGGREIGKDQVATELVFTKEAYEFPKGINRISAAGAIKVDPAKGTIDFTPNDGPAKGKTLLGIYKVEGDTLTLCYRSAGNARPTELKSDNLNTVVAKYERKK